MTLQELDGLVTRLSKFYHVKKYQHFNPPVVSPWIMALHIQETISEDDLTMLTGLGFKRLQEGDSPYFTIERTEA